jgi:hypothetical protein
LLGEQVNTGTVCDTASAANSFSIDANKNQQQRVLTTSFIRTDARARLYKKKKNEKKNEQTHEHTTLLHRSSAFTGQFFLGRLVCTHLETERHQSLFAAHTVVAATVLIVSDSVLSFLHPPASSRQSEQQQQQRAAAAGGPALFSRSRSPPGERQQFARSATKLSSR